MKDIFGNKFGTFLKQGVKIIVALYTEFIGFEINTYLCGRSHDQDQITAFVSFVNLTALLFTCGLGFGNVTRSALANYIGAGKPVQAKNVQRFYSFIVLVIGIIAMALVMGLKAYIVLIYTAIPNVDQWLQKIFLVYSIGVVGEIMEGTLNTTLRVANRTGTLLIIALSTFVAQTLLCSYLFAFVLNMQVVGLVVSFVCVIVTCNICYASVIVAQVDWAQIKLTED